jgi:hypothetical protein
MNNVPLTPSQIHFIMDLMMGCPMGYTKDHAMQHGISDTELYDHLEKCLPNPPEATEHW